MGRKLTGPERLRSVGIDKLPRAKNPHQGKPCVYSIIPAEAKRYEQLTGAGPDVDDVRDLTLKLAGLEPEEEGDTVSALQPLNPTGRLILPTP